MDNNKKKNTAERKSKVNNKVESKSKGSKTTTKKATSKTVTSKKVNKNPLPKSNKSKKVLVVEDSIEIKKATKKTSKTPKKILTIDDEVKINDNILDKTNTKIPIKKVKKQSVKNEEETILKDKVNDLDNTGIIEPKKLSNTTDIVPKKLTQKEINRKKYEKAQQRYRTTKVKTQEKIELNEINKEDETLPKKEEIKEEKTLEDKSKKQNKFTNFFKNIFRKYRVNLANENNFYLQVESKKKRFTKYVKEASIYAIVITIINILLIFLIKDLDTINLFDIKALNVVLTMLVILIISFLVSLLFDFLITEIWIKIKRKRISKKKESEHRGD